MGIKSKSMGPPGSLEVLGGGQPTSLRALGALVPGTEAPCAPLVLWRSMVVVSQAPCIPRVLHSWVQKLPDPPGSLDLDQIRTAETIMDKAVQKDYYELENLSLGDD